MLESPPLLDPWNLLKLTTPFAVDGVLLRPTSKGYEGEGGLHKLLHGRGWVSSLSAGSMVTGTDFQLFRLSLSLTEEGERHTDEIIELCHLFIALLRSEPPQKRIRVCTFTRVYPRYHTLVSAAKPVCCRVES